MHVIRELPRWSPLYLLDGQSLLRCDPFLCELSLTLGPQSAARCLIGLVELVASHLRQATILALDPATVGDLSGEPDLPTDESVRFAVALPDPSIPYDMAFRGLVQGKPWRNGEALLVVSDDTALCYEARGHLCVVMGVDHYRERAMRALARRYGVLEASSDGAAASAAMVQALIQASRRGLTQ